MPEADEWRRVHLLRGAETVETLTLCDIHGNGRRNRGWCSPWDRPGGALTLYSLREVNAYAKANGLKVRHELRGEG